jgi:hypothetical protein
MRARIWTGGSSVIDGCECDSREEAVAALREWRGWPEVYEVEHCGGFAVSCYGSQEDANEDRYGAWADMVMDIDTDTDID